jgi:hypothetical protein
MFSLSVECLQCRHRVADIDLALDEEAGIEALNLSASKELDTKHKASFIQ